MKHQRNGIIAHPKPVAVQAKPNGEALCIKRIMIAMAIIIPQRKSLCGDLAISGERNIFIFLRTKQKQIGLFMKCLQFQCPKMEKASVFIGEKAIKSLSRSSLKKEYPNTDYRAFLWPQPKRDGQHGVRCRHDADQHSGANQRRYTGSFGRLLCDERRKMMIHLFALPSRKWTDRNGFCGKRELQPAAGSVFARYRGSSVEYGMFYWLNTRNHGGH